MKKPNTQSFRATAILKVLAARAGARVQRVGHPVNLHSQIVRAQRLLLSTPHIAGRRERDCIIAGLDVGGNQRVVAQ